MRFCRFGFVGSQNVEMANPADWHGETDEHNGRQPTVKVL